MKFPRYERNQIKKGLIAFSLELFIHNTIWDMHGDEVDIYVRVFTENAGAFRYVDYDTPEGEREKEADIGKSDAYRFLKSVIYEYDALFWEEDLSDAEPDDFDPFADDESNGDADEAAPVPARTYKIHANLFFDFSKDAINDFPCSKEAYRRKFHFKFGNKGNGVCRKQMVKCQYDN